MRLNKADRQAHIVATGVKIANRSGLTSANWSSVAEASSVPISARTVRWYYPNQRDLWIAISRADGIDPHVLDTAADLKLFAPA